MVRRILELALELLQEGQEVDIHGLKPGPQFDHVQAALARLHPTYNSLRSTQAGSKISLTKPA